MKHSHAYLVLLLLFAVACDGPSRIRSTSTGVSLSGVQTGSTNGTGSSGGDTTTTTTTTTGTSLPAGFTACNTSAQYSQTSLGAFSVCQSSANELYFRVGYTTTDQTDGTCIVPMYRDSSGNSTYLGSPQCTKHNAGQVVYGYVSKNRAGYSSYPVNSVMLMKYSSTTAFNQCMQAYDTSYASCKTSTCAQAYGFNASLYQQCLASTSPITTCDDNAKRYMNSVCTTFKSGYAYIQITTK